METDNSNNSAHLPKKAAQQINSAYWSFNTTVKPGYTNLEIGQAVVEENMPSV